MKKTKTLVGSLVAIVICFTMLLGTTFAWFTDSTSSTGNIIKSGTLKVNAYWMEAGKDPETDTWTNFNDTENPIFNNVKWEPGYVEAKHLKVTNDGSLAFEYKLVIKPNGAVSELADVIEVYYLPTATMLSQRAEVENGVNIGTLADLIADPDGAAYGILLPDGATPTNDKEVVKEVVVTIAFKLPEEVGNEYQDKSIGSSFDIVVYATQYEFEEDSFGKDYDKDAEYDITDEWDGTADTSWYDPSNPKTEYNISSAEQFAGLSELVSGDVTFKGVTFTLACDIDLFCEDTSENADGDPVTFRPIGDHSKDGTFEGTFDGNGKVISNLYQNGWDLGYQWGAYGSYGLFGNLNDATIKNLTIAGAESLIEGGDVGGVCGSATGTCVFENITIEDSDFATYNNGNGGIIGWSGAGNYTFKNITIAEDVTLAGLWGSFDSSIGGIVGQAEPGATYNFENVEISCRIDAYNDCTASYDYYNYRMCGMIIGRCEETTTINGKNYPDLSKYNMTFNNVTVNYGDWMNYHYCDPTPGYNNGRGMRVEPGYAYDGLPADYDHSQCTTHHNELIPFDQLVGGDQLGVKGLPTVDGVTVSYPN